MEGVRREHLGSADVEEPQRSHMDTAEEMGVAPVGVRGRRRQEPRSTSRPAFMVSKAADAAVWEDLKDIKPPTYDGNPLNLDRFLEKLDDWGMTVTEDMDPAEAEKYVFKRFRYRLPEVLQELYFVATKEGKIKTLKEAKKCLNGQEQVDAPQVAAKRWKAIKLHPDGQEIRLPDWRDFRGQYTLFRRNVEDWNEGDEQARLLSMLPEAWIKRVTKEEAKRAKSNHTVKMMLSKEYHRNVVAWTRKNVTRDVKQHSLRNVLLITVTGDREKTAMWRLNECDVGDQTICLQTIPARMSCEEVLEWVGEEVLKEYRNLQHTRGLRPGDRDINYVGEGSGGEAAMDPARADGDQALDDDDNNDGPRRNGRLCLRGQQPERREQPGKLEAPAEGFEEEREEGAAPHRRPSAVLWGVHTSSPLGLFRVLLEEQRVQPCPPDMPHPQSRHGGLQEGALVEEACTRGYPGDEGGGRQGRALQADVGRNRVGQGDPGDQEVLGSQVG